MNKSTIALVPLLLLAFAWQPAGQIEAAEKIDRVALGKAWRSAKQAIKDPEWPVADTLERLKKLEGLLDYKTAKELLGYFDECNDAWDKEEKNKLGRRKKGGRPPEAYIVANGILDAVRKMKVPSEAMKFANKGELEDFKKHSLRVRMSMLDAIVNCAADEDIQKWLLAYSQNRESNADMRILAVRALDAVEDELAVLKALLICLTDPSWRIREAAVQAMVDVAKHDEDRAIVALIDRLAQETGRMRKAIASALQRITGQRLGTNSDVWVEWFKEKKRNAAGLPPLKGKKNDRGSEVVFKTESFSNRYVFVLDTSISMMRPLKPEEKEELMELLKQDKDDTRPELPWDKINSKADLAREEIIRSLSSMDAEQTKFTLVTFDAEIKIWDERLVDATPKNIKYAANWLRSIKGGQRTDVFGAIDAVYDLCEKIAGADENKRKKKKRKKKKKDKVITGKHPDEGLPDTVFLYSDGWATQGKYAGRDKEWQAKKLSNIEKAKLYGRMMDYMVKEIADRNRIARLTINCVGVGGGSGRPPDNRTLRKIAKTTGGKYIKISKR